jgi:NAD(P)-dependent dehydrogenase (short-subunit alcohol dehydrogenase family)
VKTTNFTWRAAAGRREDFEGSKRLPAVQKLQDLCLEIRLCRIVLESLLVRNNGMAEQVVHENLPIEETEPFPPFQINLSKRRITPTTRWQHDVFYAFTHRYYSERESAMELSALNQFSLEDKVAVITGGTGVLGGALAHGFAAAGARVAILGRRADKAAEVAAAIVAAGGEAMPLLADVLDVGALRAARESLLASFGRVDILLNAAGGNMPGATVFGDLTFFTMQPADFERVVQLNLTGTLLPSQLFGEPMAAQGSGAIINISSMTAQKPLTRVLGYGNAKAAIDNFTRWLAVELAQKYGAGLRVNAIAPGFFIGEQNRGFLLNADGTYTTRGQSIIDHTPQKRYGEPKELVGTAVWLASDASRFVTGVVVPVDGGFSAFSGI